jgi:PAS domain S-box-containing protein
MGKLGVWEHNLITDKMTADAACRAALGFSADGPVTYAQIESRLPAEDVERLRQAVAYALKTRTEFNITHRVLWPNDRTSRVHVRGQAIFKDGKPVCIYGVTQDVTELEKVREEASVAQRRQEFLLALTDQLGSLEDPFQIMEIASRSLANFLKVDNAGYSVIHEDRRIVIVQREWANGIFNNEGRIAPYSELAVGAVETWRQGQAVIFNDVTTDPRLADPERQACYSGVNIRTIVTAPVLVNGHLSAAAYVSSSAPRQWHRDDVKLIGDVAERTFAAVEKARARARRREEEARVRTIAEALPALIWTTDLEFKLTYANDHWYRFSGVTPEGLLGGSWTDWVHPEDLARAIGDIKLAQKNKSVYTTEIRYRSAKGTYRWHMLQAAPVFDAAGRMNGYAGTSIDIHDFKETKQSL